MVAVIEREVVEYKSAQDLMNNNADDGSWKGKFKDKFEERSEQIEKIKASLNEEAALGNITAAQQAQESQYIINPITGEVVEIDSGFEDELSVASVISLIEKGASDSELESALDAALSSIAGKIGKDKKNAKKHMAHLLELLHVLEVSMKQSGKNTELQNTLRQVQERVSKLIKNGTAQQVQEFLKSNQLREVLTKSVQQSRQQVDVLKSVRDLTRNLAAKVKESGIPRELALKNLQQVSKNIVTSQLRDAVSQLKETYKKLSEEFKSEKDPIKKEALKETIKDVIQQAQKIQTLAKDISQKPELTTKQFEQSQKTLQQLQKQTEQIAKNPQLSQKAQQVVNKLANGQQANLQAINARFAAQRVTEGNLNIANQSAKQNAIENLKANEQVLTRTQQRVDNPKQAEQPIEQKQPDKEIKTEIKSEPNKAELKQEIKAEQPSIKEPQQAKAEVNPETKIEGEKANIEAINAQRMQQKEGLKKIKAPDCANCDTSRGCCTPVGKVEAKTVEGLKSEIKSQVQQNATQQITTTQTANLNNRHEAFKESLKSSEKTEAAKAVEEGFGTPPANIKVGAITAPPPPLISQSTAP